MSSSSCIQGGQSTELTVSLKHEQERNKKEEQIPLTNTTSTAIFQSFLPTSPFNHHHTLPLPSPESATALMPSPFSMPSLFSSSIPSSPPSPPPSLRPPLRTAPPLPGARAPQLSPRPAPSLRRRRRGSRPGDGASLAARTSEGGVAVGQPRRSPRGPISSTCPKWIFWRYHRG